MYNAWNWGAIVNIVRKVNMLLGKKRGLNTSVSIKFIGLVGIVLIAAVLIVPGFASAQQQLDSSNQNQESTESLVKENNGIGISVSTKIVDLFGNEIHQNDMPYLSVVKEYYQLFDILPILVDKTEKNHTYYYDAEAENNYFLDRQYSIIGEEVPFPIHPNALQYTFNNSGIELFDYCDVYISPCDFADSNLMFSHWELNGWPLKPGEIGNLNPWIENHFTAVYVQNSNMNITVKMDINKDKCIDIDNAQIPEGWELINGAYYKNFRIGTAISEVYSEWENAIPIKPGFEFLYYATDSWYPVLLQDIEFYPVWTEQFPVFVELDANGGCFTNYIGQESNCNWTYNFDWSKAYGWAPYNISNDVSHKNVFGDTVKGLFYDVEHSYPQWKDHQFVGWNPVVGSDMRITANRSWEAAWSNLKTNHVHIDYYLINNIGNAYQSCGLIGGTDFEVPDNTLYIANDEWFTKPFLSLTEPIASVEGFNSREIIPVCNDNFSFAFWGTWGAENSGIIFEDTYFTAFFIAPPITSLNISCAQNDAISSFEVVRDENGSAEKYSFTQLLDSPIYSGTEISVDENAALVLNFGDQQENDSNKKPYYKHTVITPNLLEGVEFINWTFNGVELEVNKPVYVESFKDVDIKLNCKVPGVNPEPEPVNPDVPDPDNPGIAQTSDSLNYIAIALFFIFAISSSVCFGNRKKN